MLVLQNKIGEEGRFSELDAVLLKSMTRIIGLSVQFIRERHMIDQNLEFRQNITSAAHLISCQPTPELIGQYFSEKATELLGDPIELTLW